MSKNSPGTTFVWLGNDGKNYENSRGARPVDNRHDRDCSERSCTVHRVLHNRNEPSDSTGGITGPEPKRPSYSICAKIRRNAATKSYRYVQIAASRERFRTSKYRRLILNNHPVCFRSISTKWVFGTLTKP